MEEMEEAGGRKERQKRGPKNRSKSVEVAAASSSTSNDREDLEEEKEYGKAHLVVLESGTEQMAAVLVRVRWLTMEVGRRKVKAKEEKGASVIIVANQGISRGIAHKGKEEARKERERVRMTHG